MKYLRRKTTETLPAPAPPSRIIPPLEGVELPSYSAQKGICEKCGAMDALTSHHAPGRSCTHAWKAGWRTVWGQERMHRTCSVCGFAWDERLPDVNREEETSRS